MTRFARAKGSKSSNERIPEQATSWAEMKQQLLEKNQEIEESKKRNLANKQREANYKSFLEQVEDDKSKNTQWAEFEPSKSPKTKNKIDKNGNENGKTKKKRLKIVEAGEIKDDSLGKFVRIVKESEENEDGEKSEVRKVKKGKKVENNGDNIEGEKKGVKRKRNNDGGDKSVGENSENGVEKVNGEKSEVRKIKKGKNIENNEDNNKMNKKGVKKKKNNDNSANEMSEVGFETENGEKNEVKKVKKGKNIVENNQSDKKGIKRKRNNDKGNKSVKNVAKPKKDPSELTEEEKQKIEKRKEKRLKQLEKKKLRKAELKKQKETEIPSTPTPKPPKKKQKTGEKPERRKQPQNSMIVNGKEIPIAYLDGFPIKKEDAERIQQLRKQMISKGLPRSEIQIALKLERRKAEKSFARERKKVCFNCRKSGHNLSECPDLGQKQLAESAGTGICFKCGSTEHTHFECKVVRGQQFSYAQCFICGEQGHISRQCPDNARGLYPKGGACKVCGDVTHLKKDCPNYQAQQAQLQDSFSLGTMDGANPDDLGGDGENGVQKGQSRMQRPNKIIKF